MPTTYANSINNNPIYAARADADAAGNSISTTYATKSELPSGVPAVTSSDDDKVLKATYSGGTGSYAWSSVPPANAIILTSSSTWSDFHTAYSTGRKDIYYKHTNPYSPFDSRAELYLLLTAVSDVDGSSNFTFALFEGAWANGGVDYSVRCKLKYNGRPTVSATKWDVDQSYSASSKNAQSGKAVAQAISAVSQVPASTSADENKVLTVDSNGSPVWAASQGGTTYTAGDGISIANDEISAKAGTGLKIADVSETTTDNLVCAAMSSRYESGNWAQDICPMTQALADAMNTSAGYAFTLVKPFDTDNLYAWPAIAKTSELLQGELQNYAFFGNYLSCRPRTDGSDRTYEVPAGTTLTLKFSERDQFSTITVADILADLSSYSLVILWYDEDSPYAAGTMLSTAMTPETTATHTATTTLQDALCVSNPLPASTVADADKILTVNAQGAAAWGMRIQQVSALPASPDANTLYLIPEA